MGTIPQDKLRRGFTVDEVAQQYHMSRSLVYTEIQRGALDSIKFGKSRRILPRHLDLWEKRREAEAKPRGSAVR